MISTRVIPVLLLQNHQLVKTTQFKKPKYIGDCINALKIFNEKGADELVVLDIGAAYAGTPDFEFVEQLVSECFMPLAFGGGIPNY
ncbi:MAG: HisA/HisF-related TIM barrel protein [Cytophagales bacterium]|nr:HisA/HisF-related TIM barrel protein [Cytophagales bacterium]